MDKQEITFRDFEEVWSNVSLRCEIICQQIMNETSDEFDVWHNNFSLFDETGMNRGDIAAFLFSGMIRLAGDIARLDMVMCLLLVKEKVSEKGKKKLVNSIIEKMKVEAEKFPTDIRVQYIYFKYAGKEEKARIAKRLLENFRIVRTL